MRLQEDQNSARLVMPRRLVVGVTGATGHIGGQLLERLVRDPAVEEVRSVARRALVRPSGIAGPLAARALAAMALAATALSGNGSGGEGTARLVHTQADLNEPAARSALEGVDLLYHLAAQVWQSRGAAGPLQMRTTNIEGTRNMLLARPGAFVFASSVSVYGAWPDNPLPMDETDHPARTSSARMPSKSWPRNELARSWQGAGPCSGCPRCSARTPTPGLPELFALIAGLSPLLPARARRCNGWTKAMRSRACWPRALPGRGWRCRWPGAQPRDGRLAGPGRHGRAGAPPRSRVTSPRPGRHVRARETAWHHAVWLRPGGADRRSPRRLCRQSAPAPRVAADQNFGRGAGRGPGTRLARLSAQPAPKRSGRALT